MTDGKKSYCKISGLTVKEIKLFKNKWIPKYGEKLTVQLAYDDDSSSAHKYVGPGFIEVLRIDNGQTVGHVPGELQSYFHSYLKKGGHITAEVTDTKFTRCDNERELFCDYILQGPSNATIKRILNELEQALQGPGFEHYTPTLVTREDKYPSYFHHAVSKAPDLEAKCKAMSKYPKRIRRQRSRRHSDTSEDPRCSYHENSSLERKRGAEPTSHGAKPTSHGAELTSCGVVPTSNGAGQTSHGAEPTSQGAEPTSHGAGPTLHGAEPTSHVDEPTVHVDGPTLRFGGPTSHVDGPTVHVDGPTLRFGRPTSHVDGPTVHVDGPTLRFGGPTSHGAGPTSHGAGPTSHDAKPTSLITVDNVPKHLRRKKSGVTETTTSPSVEKEHEQKEIADLLPEELENDPWTRQIYESALEQGQEVDFTMRLMIIGCYEQGKSSLVKRLMGQSAEGVESTNGIEVSMCEILNDSLKWEQKETEDVATECIKRLVSVTKSVSSGSLKSLNTDDPMDIDEQNDFPDDQSDDGGIIFKINVDDDSCFDSKIKRSSDVMATNKARAEKEKEKMDSVKTKGSSSKKRIDSANVKRFSTELRKSISFEKESSKENTKILSIWDFGGQFVYYATHQLFHSRHAIYLLVFSLNESLDAVITDDEKPNNVKPKTMKEYIKFWISSVHSFVGNKQGTEPTIILVGTKKDLLNSDVDIEQKFEDVRKLFDGSKMLYHLLPDHFAISNLDESSEEITKLCECINDLTKKQCQNNLVPARWIPLERKLKENRHLKIVDLNTILKFNDENEIPIEDKDQIKLFLQYHHARGTFFYFANGDTSQVVLEPQYIVDAFKCLLTAERFCIVRPSLRESWHKLCDKAILDKHLLHDVWERDKNLDFLKFEDILIFFLKKHRIIAEALKFDENTNITAPESLGFFIVPSFLSKPDEGSIERFMKGRKQSQVSLVYVFENESVVSTLYYRLAAAGCGRWPLIEFKNETMIFENAALFKLSLDHAGLLKLNHNTLEILVIGLCPPHRVSFNDCDLFRRFIEMVMGQEFRKFRDDCPVQEVRGIYTKSVRCFHKNHGSIGSKNTIDLESLTESNRRRTGCPDNENHYLRGNKIVKEWYKAGIDTRVIPPRELSRAELSSISMLIEDNWQHLGIQLGFHKAEIEQIDMSPNLTTSMKVFEVLSRWNNREIENATLDVLVKAINKCKKVLKYDKDMLRNLIDEFDS